MSAFFGGACAEAAFSAGLLSGSGPDLAGFVELSPSVAKLLAVALGLGRRGM